MQVFVQKISGPNINVVAAAIHVSFSCFHFA